MKTKKYTCKRCGEMFELDASKTWKSHGDVLTWVSLRDAVDMLDHIFRCFVYAGYDFELWAAESFFEVGDE